MKLFLSTPATSANLGAGFDSLGIALNLRNEFRIYHSRINSIHISGFSANASAIKSNNMFVNIFKSTLKKLGAKDCNIAFSLHNGIPFSRGLGSSSSVIIAAIAAAFIWANKTLDYEQILRLSLEFEPHTDNTAPCLYGGFAISKECSLAARFGGFGELAAIIAVPKERISTAASRAALAPRVKLQDACFNLSASALISAALASGDYSLLRRAWGDRLHQRARMLPLRHIYSRIFSALIERGWLSSASVAEHFGSEFILADTAQTASALAAASSKIYFAALSGSGSSFIFLADKTSAPDIAAALKTCALEAVFTLDIDERGLYYELTD